MLREHVYKVICCSVIVTSNIITINLIRFLPEYFWRSALPLSKIVRKLLWYRTVLAIHVQVK